MLLFVPLNTFMGPNTTSDGRYHCSVYHVASNDIKEQVMSFDLKNIPNWLQ